MVPAGNLSRWKETQGFPTSSRVTGQCLQKALHFPHIGPPREGNGSELVVVNTPGQFPKDRMPHLGGPPVHHELIPPDTDGEDGTGGQDFAETRQDVLRHLTEGRVVRWVHGIPVHPDGELQQELGKLPGEGSRTLLAGAGVGGWVLAHVRGLASMAGRMVARHLRVCYPRRYILPFQGATSDGACGLGAARQRMSGAGSEAGLRSPNLAVSS